MGHGINLGTHYPIRLVDHIKAARHARDKIYTLRADQTYRETARAIVTRHGSRKRKPVRAKKHQNDGAKPSLGSAESTQLHFGF